MVFQEVSASSATSSTSDSPSVEDRSSSDEGSSTASPAPSGPIRGSLSYALAVQDLAVGVVAVGEHQNSGYLG